MIRSLSAAIYLVLCGSATAATIVATGHELFEGAEPVLHFTFERTEDRDHDRQPDDWSRRKGPQFPAYIETRIDREYGRNGGQSLRFDVNGGPAVVYSPPLRINELHALVFEGYVRTQYLVDDAALISVSFLNAKRQRVQRFLSAPVGGTHREWVRVRLGPLEPKPEVRFVVLGCHLVNGKKFDIRGRVWFDDLWLGRLPQLKLMSNFNEHFKRYGEPLNVTSNVSGLDPGRDYHLQLELLDSDGNVITTTSRPLKTDAPGTDAPEGAAPPTSGRPPEVWSIPPQRHGFYQIRSTLNRDNTVIVDQRTSVAVIEMVEPRRSGEFGWSILREVDGMPIRELVDVSAQAGINWVKYPLWQSAHGVRPGETAATSLMLEDLNRRGITPVGLLNQPPVELRKKFSRDWSGISEIFTMPPSFWSSSMDTVIARYSTQVRHWQLGGETDGSFVGMNNLGETLTTIKRAFDRIGRDTLIGVHWDWEAALPSRRDVPRGFLSLSPKPDSKDSPERLSTAELIEKLRQSEQSGIPRWVLLKPLPRSGHSPAERSADLVKRMVAARIGGAEAIFAYDVFDEEFGLLNADGSPTLLFLPWRSTALALQDAEYLGSLHLPNKSTNHAFARDGEVTLIVWNDEPAVEEVYLGERPTIIDAWGRRLKVVKAPGTTQHRIPVGTSPLIIRGCSEPIARWRLAVQFENGRLRSETAEQSESILGRNTFPQGVSGRVTLNLPDEWKVDRNSWPLTMAAGEPFTLPMLLTLPANASLGVDELSIDFDISADQPYRFRISRPYRVGLGDVSLQVVDREDEDGRLRIEQIITNRTTTPTEVLNFRCSLFIPGHRRQKKVVVKLGAGEDHQFYFVPDADELRGKEFWLRAEQIHGPRVLNFKWVVGENWDESTDERKSAINDVPTRTLEN